MQKVKKETSIFKDLKKSAMEWTKKAESKHSKREKV